jgi:deferrochelatase/peroxidase EfeB
MSTTVEIDDVQSLVFSGHSRLPASLVLGLTVRDRALARRGLTNFVTSNLAVGFGDKSRTHAAQLLLTAGGIMALGGSESDLTGFSRQFRQGIVAPQRSRALGDAGPSAPAGWAWSDLELHALVLIYGTDDATAIGAADEVIAQLAPGFSITLRFPLRLPADGREPFGFADGLSLTRVDVGDGRPGGPGVALLPPGEVVFGYENAAGITPPVPPLGENGTLVVLRQLEQDVQAFWDFWRRQGRDDHEAVWLASKALGRWPNGMPIDGEAPMPEPTFDEAVALAPLQFQADPRGRKCPFGAHVRRANPRDGLGDDPVASLAVVSHHRMLRRGRVYGPPAPLTWYPESIHKAQKRSGDPTEAGPRGLLFVSLCVDIARQFEFIQQTWLNNPKFSDLYDEVDPIAAGYGIPADSRRFSIPRPPLRRRLSGVARCVQVRGGGYFLMPGKRALLRFLGSQLAGAVRCKTD